MNNFFYKKILPSLYATFLLAGILHTVNAETINIENSGVSIENNISASASTGGNTGTNTAGSAKSSVSIKTVVNGEVVEDINETIIGASGEDAVIHKETSVNVNAIPEVRPLEKSLETKIIPEVRPLENEEKPTEVEKKNFITLLISKIFKYVFAWL